jgi:hypothetical protein
MHKLIIATALLLAGASLMRGQTVDFNQQRVPMADLDGPWRFHAGDDSAWADPGYDDSGWPLLMAGKTWSEQGYRGQDMGWYRLGVVIPARPGPLAIYFPEVEDSFQVFANGHMIGQVGDLPPHPRFVLSSYNLFRIPSDAISPGQPLVLAVRVWRAPPRGANGGGLDESPRFGAAHQITTWRRLQKHYLISVITGEIAEFFCDVLTALAGIGLFLLRPKERGYLWWGVSQLLWTSFIAVQLRAGVRDTPYIAIELLSLTLMALATYFQFEFYITFLRQPRNWLYWVCICLLASSIVIGFGILLANGNAMPVLLSDVARALVQACFVGVLWRGTRKNRIDAALLLVPNCVMFSFNLLEVVCHLPSLDQSHWAQWTIDSLGRAITWPFRMSAFDLTGLFEMFAVLVILLRSYVHTREDEERLESELEAARAVQKVLIPDEVPTIPGFAVETVYRPASQVGGDFFQITPLKAGGALIVIGDVSGKGMPAAMTVSLLVGTVRTLAHYTQSPGEILAAMNQRMLARSSGGFTTCLVMRADLDGTLTAANAGHIAPYLNGAELKLENGLPLGLAAETQYVESTFRFVASAKLTLLTDGVVEARTATGELFGFDRTRAISTESANQIAQAAQHFGQEDDITVLTLTHAAMEALHA